jgi:hypothetical protein
MAIPPARRTRPPAVQRLGRRLPLPLARQAPRTRQRRHRHLYLSFSAWATLLGDAKTTAAPLDRLTRRHVLEIRTDRFPFENSSARTTKTIKETTRRLIAA